MASPKLKTSKQPAKQSANNTRTVVHGRAQPAITHEDLMHATPGKLFSGRGWIYELKHDGYRCLITKWRDAVRLECGNGCDIGPTFPELVNEIHPIPHDFVADSALVVLDEEGRAVWERVQARHRLKDQSRIRYAALEEPAAIFAFDVLWLDGADLRRRSLLQRKDALHRMLPSNRRIRYAAHMVDRCSDLWQLATSMDLEGIVAKRADSIYTAGRSDAWVEINTDVGDERERARRPKCLSRL